jgi:glycosyltransferase involved in cell wall biosynthesis
MPCHNEMHTIRNNIAETVGTLKQANNGSFEVIVVDDGSSDSTFREIKNGARDNGYVKFLKLEHNHGKGHALRKGFEHANGKYVCFLDGDLDIHPRLIRVFLEMMKMENADIVIGSKRHPRSNVNYPASRKMLSVAYQWVVKRMFDLSITDSQVGLKLFRREVLDEIFPKVLVKKYAFDIELLVNAHHCGYKIIEAPIEMDFLNAVGSDVDIRAVSRMFLDTCAIFYRLNVLHYYDNGNSKAIMRK